MRLFEYLFPCLRLKKIRQVQKKNNIRLPVVVPVVVSGGRLERKKIRNFFSYTVSYPHNRPGGGK